MPCDPGTRFGKATSLETSLSAAKSLSGNTSAISMIWVLDAFQLTPVARLAANARDAVDADVMPEQ